MEAMRDSGKPAVGHNLSFDLAFSLHSYAEVWWWCVGVRVCNGGGGGELLVLLLV